MPHSLIFLHQYFAPELAGSAQQLTDLVLGLKDKGHSVQVVTGQPSYSSKGKLPSKENFKGVQIYRVPKFQFSRDWDLGRILSAISFFVTALLKLVGMDRQALLVIGSDPPFLPLLGWFFRVVRGQRYVLIVSDIYPDVAVALGELSPTGWVTKMLEGSNRGAYGRAEKIVVLGEKMSEHLRSKYLNGKNTDKIHVIHNWADGERFRPLAKSENPFCQEHKLSNSIVVLFSGNLGKIYNFDDVIKAAHSLKGDSSVEFLFIGEGPLRKVLENQAVAGELRNFRFLPYQPDKELPYSLASGDLALVSLRKEVTGLCVPGKLYYALAAGIPLLVIASEDSEPAQIVKDYDCGWLIPQGKTEATANLLKGLCQNSGLLDEKRKKARACFEAHFTKERAVRQYEAIFSGL